MYQNYYKLKEEDDKYVIDIYAPGLKKEKFEVSLEDKTLTVSYPEQFSKQFHLPPHKEVDVRYKDGVLKIKVLKSDKNLIKVA